MRNARILIVGGGASGVILAAHLLRADPARFDITIIERRPIIGAGIAYGTDEPEHLLNTRISGMSAFPDDPDHFWRWLQGRGPLDGVDCSDPFCFVPRHLYREYLKDIVAPWLGPDGDGRLHVVEGECVALREVAGGVAVELSDGRTEIAGTVALATGHAVPAYAPDAPYSGPWCSREELGIQPHGDVLIVGTGLSMVDNVMQLRRGGHQGRITAVSRRGLLPRVHAPSVPLKLDPADIPFGTSVSFLLRWLRQTVRWAEAEGGGWRDVVDALRPHTQGLWQAMTPDMRRRFLRHARTFWEMHRHRLAPTVERALREAIADGQLRIVAARIHGVETAGDRSAVTLRRRGGGEETVVVDRIIDCTGVLRDPTSGGSHVIARLVDSGAARLDALGIGIEVDPRCAIVGADGLASKRVFAVGPVTRARFWEITAIPDIRVQCAALARTLAGDVQY